MIINQVEKMVSEMLAWFDHAGINIQTDVYLYPDTIGEILLEESKFTRMPTPEKVTGFTNLTYYFHQGCFSLIADKRVEHGDIVILDREGNRYSYNEHYLSEAIEKTLLGRIE